MSISSPIFNPPTIQHESNHPRDYNRASLIELDGLPLERHYRNTLENLGKEPGILGVIFRKAQKSLSSSPPSLTPSGCLAAMRSPTPKLGLPRR